ncbi:MAG: dUTP diphosphatase [Deltaproteobacteria bacterium]|nr:dUTP diphosphatase [Deltaproteobacteria bacterium]
MQKLNIRIRLLSPGARVPSKSHHGDAGWDLFASSEVTVLPGETRVVPTGVAMEIPAGWYGQIKARSGLGSKGVVVTAGVVDSGYRGEIGAVVVNTKREGEFVFRAGDKVAQMVFLPVPEVEFELREELDATARGAGGFGSTGHK